MENKPEQKQNFETGLDTADDRNVITSIALNAVNKLLAVPRKISALAHELNVGLGNTKH